MSVRPTATLACCRATLSKTRGPSRLAHALKAGAPKFAIGLALVFSSARLAHAEDFPFAGTWKITGTVHAPWEDPGHPMVTDDEQRYGGQLVTISRASISGPDLMGCGKTNITVETLPFAGLFEGGLASDPKDPAAYDEDKAKQAAMALGFTAEPVPTLFQGCSEVSLHLRDAETLMFGLNNRIFTMKKQ